MDTRYDILSDNVDLEHRETYDERRERRQREREARQDFESRAYDQACEVKQRLTQAFKALRKQGFIARQNFCCCGSCAGCQIASDVEKKVDAGKLKDNFKGAVYYSKQGNMFDVFRGRTTIRRMHLTYGPVSCSKHGDQEFGVSTKECGKIICQALTEAGVPYSWDDDPNSCIIIEPVKDLLADKSNPTHEYEREQQCIGVRG